jgi:putative ATPase
MSTLFDDQEPPREAQAARREETPETASPLAERMRPRSLDEVVGHQKVLGPDGFLRRAIAADRVPSLIFWGPPGSGKTTLARVIAAETSSHFVPFSAVTSGIKEVKEVMAEAVRLRRAQGRRTLLFVDEIHRFNRAQQDAFLPYVERGDVVLVGATTENPSFELNAALLSRCQVLVLKRLDDAALGQLLERAEAALGRKLPIDEQGRQAIFAMADGDGRYLITLAEQLAGLKEKGPVPPARLATLLQKRAPLYDKAQEAHYNLISALHKSLRGSDVDAALYWFARMLDGGEDPKYIARRLVRFAVEDIGMADPNALTQTLAAWDTYDRLGSPEGELAIAQAVIYLGTAPKSNSGYTAFSAAKRAAKEHGSLTPPMHILNAPTRLMKDLGYAKGYEYDHNAEDGFSGQNYFPDGMAREEFYQPVERGFEREILKRLEYWKKLRDRKRSG